MEDTRILSGTEIWLVRIHYHIYPTRGALMNALSIQLRKASKAKRVIRNLPWVWSFNIFRNGIPLQRGFPSPLSSEFKAWPRRLSKCQIKSPPCARSSRFCSERSARRGVVDRRATRSGRRVYAPLRAARATNGQVVVLNLTWPRGVMCLNGHVRLWEESESVSGLI